MTTTDGGGQERLDFFSRLSDRLNPILVRELQQAFAARSFMFVISLALIAILIFALVVALQGEEIVGEGRDVFTAVLMVMSPVLMLTLPMQAFNSMQHELREGAVDQLQMSELTPRRIVRGKILASFVLIAMFLAVFAPLLALTFLLRGIDVPTIALCLALGVLFALGAAAIGMAAGAITAIKPLQQLARVGVSFGLAMMTIGSIGAMWDLVRDVSRSSYDEIGAMVASLLVGIVFLNQVAGAVLTHPYENRSTPFRVFALSATILAFAVTWLLARPSDLDEAGPGVMLGISFCMIPFVLAWTTEPTRLSPRVRTLVPRRPGLALLSAPFLPGSDRGLLFMLLLWAVAAVGMFALPASGSRTADWRMVRLAFLLVCYIAIYAVLLRRLRGDGTGPRPRVRALLVFTVILALGCIVPLLFDLFGRGRLHDWHLGHLFNPFYTLAEIGWRGDESVVVLLGGLAGALLLVSVPRMARGVREVMEASRARRG